MYQLEQPQGWGGPHFPSKPGSLRCCPSHSFTPSSSAVLFSGHRQPEHGNYLASGFLGISSAPRLGSRLLLPGGARLEIQLSTETGQGKRWATFRNDMPELFGTNPDPRKRDLPCHADRREGLEALGEVTKEKPPQSLTPFPT